MILRPPFTKLVLPFSFRKSEHRDVGKEENASIVEDMREDYVPVTPPIAYSDGGPIDEVDEGLEVGEKCQRV